MMEEYSANYKKRCKIRGANFVRAVQLKRFHFWLLELGVDLDLARNEASNKRVAVLVIEMEKMMAEKIAPETQT